MNPAILLASSLVNAKHFLPKSLSEAPIKYSSRRSIMRSRSWNASPVHLVFQLIHPDIDGISPEQVFLENCIRPTAEQYALRRFHTIPNGQYDIQAVVFNTTHNLTTTLLLKCRKFCDSWNLWI